MSIKAEQIQVLSAPFDEKTLGVKVNNFSKDKTKAMLVPYLQHTDVYVRIEKVDPAWSSETMDIREAKESVFVRVKLTILGVSRDNWGEGQDYKSAASDAIKRAAMLFGVGRYLYDAENVWVAYDDNRDRFRTWTYSDYKNGLRQGQASLPVGPAQEVPKVVVQANKPKTIAQLSVELNSAADALGITRSKMLEWATEVTGKAPAKMGLADMEKFLGVMQFELGRAGKVG